MPASSLSSALESLVDIFLIGDGTRGFLGLRVFLARAAALGPFAGAIFSGACWLAPGAEAGMEEDGPAPAGSSSWSSKLDKMGAVSRRNGGERVVSSLSPLLCIMGTRRK